MPNIIEVNGLRKVYRIGKEKIVALDHISFAVKKGEICCILGTSGSGKSTLLNMLAGLEKPTRGSVVINGRDITGVSEKKLAVFRQKNIGFIFQSYNLINTLTSLENVALPLVFRGMGRRARLRAARKILKDVQLGTHLRHKPSQMSGGQQQRVGIARAFVAKPSVIFADEPTGNLDSKTTEEVMRIMLDIAREENQTLIIVTHDRDIAAYARRVLFLFDGNITYDMQIDEQEYESRAEISKAILEEFDKQKANASRRGDPPDTEKKRPAPSEPDPNLTITDTKGL